VLFYSEENILAVRIAELVFINAYFPYDRKSIQSLNKFAKTCSVLKKVADSASSFGYQFVVAWDFYADLLNSNLRSDLVFQSLSKFKLLDKNRSFSYFHHSGSHTNIDLVLCSPNLSVSIVSVYETESDTDHLPISFSFDISLSLDISRVNRRWFTRRNWNKANWALYISTLAALLSTIKVPFQLLHVGSKFVNDNNF
jgi:exonuclease III